jgi:hypothetical protein
LNRALRQKPRPLFTLVNPVLDHAGGGDSLCRSPIALLIEMDHVFHRCRFLTDSLSAAQKTAFPQ